MTGLNTELNEDTLAFIEKMASERKDGGILSSFGNDLDAVYTDSPISVAIMQMAASKSGADVSQYTGDGIITNQEQILIIIAGYHSESANNKENPPTSIDIENAKKVIEAYDLEDTPHNLDAIADFEQALRIENEIQLSVATIIRDSAKQGGTLMDVINRSINAMEEIDPLNSLPHKQTHPTNMSMIEVLLSTLGIFSIIMEAKDISEGYSTKDRETITNLQDTLKTKIEDPLTTTSSHFADKAQPPVAGVGAVIVPESDDSVERYPNNHDAQLGAFNH